MRLVCGDGLRPYLPQIAELIRRGIPTFTLDPERTQAIAAVNGQSVCAVVLYDHYRGQDIEMSIASTGPEWCKRGILAGFFDYPFNQLGCGRVTAIIQKKNRLARRFVTRLGFRQEGVHPYPDETMISYGLLRKDCRWL